MLAACSGRDVPARASDAFIEKTFDSFAASFDAKLASLAYRAPALVAEMLADADVEASRSLDVARRRLWYRALRSAHRAVRAAPGRGRPFRGDARSSARGNVYDELAKRELTAFLRDPSGSFDVIVSADTLVYFGPLKAVAAAAANALRPGGVSTSPSRNSTTPRATLGTPSARTGVTATRPATSSACWRTRDCSPRSFPLSCDSRPASRSRGLRCERRKYMLGSAPLAKLAQTSGRGAGARAGRE